MIQQINHLDLEQEIGLKETTNYKEHIMMMIKFRIFLIINLKSQ